MDRDGAAAPTDGRLRRRIPAVVLSSALDPSLLERVCVFERWRAIHSALDCAADSSSGVSGPTTPTNSDPRCEQSFVHFEISPRIVAVPTEQLPAARPEPTAFAALDRELSRRRRGARAKKQRVHTTSSSGSNISCASHDDVDVVGRVVAVTPILDITKGLKHLFVVELAEVALAGANAAAPGVAPHTVTVFFRNTQLHWHPFFAVDRAAAPAHWVWRVTAVRAREIARGTAPDAARARVLVATESSEVHRWRADTVAPRAAAVIAARAAAPPPPPTRCARARTIDYTGTLTACVSSYVWQLDHLDVTLMLTRAANVRRANGAGCGSGGLSAAMRVGAVVRIIGAVPVYAAHAWDDPAQFGRLVALGATLRTQVQIVTFSPLFAPAPPSALGAARAAFAPRATDGEAQERRLRLMLARHPLPVAEWILRTMAALAAKFAHGGGGGGVGAEHRRGIVRELLRPRISPAYAQWLTRSGWVRDVFAEALPRLSAAAAQRAARPTPLRAPLWRVPTLHELACSAHGAMEHKAALAVGWLECSDDGLGMFLRDDSARLRVELAHLVPEHFLLCRRARVVAAAPSAKARGGDGAAAAAARATAELARTARECARSERFDRGVYSCDAPGSGAAGSVLASTRGAYDTAGREAIGGPEGGAVHSAFATDALPASPLQRAARGCCCIGADAGTGAGPCGFGQHLWAISRFSVVRRSGAGVVAPREAVLVADMRDAVCLSARATRAAQGAVRGASGLGGGASAPIGETIDVRIVSKPAATWEKVTGSRGGGARALQCTVDARLLSA
jgi:hypothetical protein